MIASDKDPFWHLVHKNLLLLETMPKNQKTPLAKIERVKTPKKACKHF
jgi:hypothetical protein